MSNVPAPGTPPAVPPTSVPSPAPPAPTPPAPAPGAPPATPPPATPPTDTSDPKWLGQRIAQAKESATKETLKALGVESLDDAKARIAAAKTAEDAGKTQAQKDADR